MREGRLSALVLLLALGGCVREQISPPADVQAAPLPSPSRQSEPLKEPPTVARPELATPPEPGTEKGARDFVTGFMMSRMARDERLARTFLSPTAGGQFAKGEGGLTLAATYAGWDLVSVNAADASSFEVTVSVREKGAGGGETTHTETLFIGPGPDLQGTQRPWVVRGVRREG